jgi:hypothetical protein
MIRRCVRHRRTLLISLVSAGVLATTAGGALAGGNPTGQWVSAAAVQRSFINRPFDVMTCSQGGLVMSPCNVLFDNLVGDPITFRIGVVSARVRGIGPSRVMKGQRRHQLFEGRVCGLNYREGGARVSAHFVWFTRRPRTVHSDGKGGGWEDSGGPYAVDWKHRAFVPFAHQGC